MWVGIVIDVETMSQFKLITTFLILIYFYICSYKHMGSNKVNNLTINILLIRLGLLNWHDSLFQMWNSFNKLFNIMYFKLMSN